LADEPSLLEKHEKIPSLASTGVVLAGDLDVRENLDCRGGSGDVLAVWKAFERRCRWAVGVAGNHDSFGSKPRRGIDPGDLRRQPNIHFLDGSMVELDGLKIAGLSGIVGNPRRPFRRRESDYVDAVSKLRQSRPDILIWHDGPEVPQFGFQGNSAVREALEKERSMLVICGHSHWESPLALLNNGTQIVNVGGRVI
jgi:predicted phosphodiesterase